MQNNRPSRSASSGRPVPASRPRQIPRPKPPRFKSPLRLALIDILCIGICLVLFALSDHVIPKPARKVTPTTVPTATSTPMPTATPDPAQETSVQITPEPTAEPTPTPVIGDFSDKFADKFTSGEVIATENSYQSANVNITVTQYRNENPLLTYYVQDIYIRSIDCLRTCFAEDTFGKSIVENVLDMAVRNSAIAAINSDFYGYGNAGVVIRNGELYRREWESGEQVLLIYRDGSMVIYRDESELDIDQAMSNGAWQSFSFGPPLVENGQPCYEATDGLYEKDKGTYHDPRTIIGMYEPGHYAFIVADGRQEEDNYSHGLTYPEAVELCQSLGLTLAYNLDGGRTSQMTFLNEITNQPYKNGRQTSDLIYIADTGA